MPYKNTKVYYDGSHYITIPPERFPRAKKRRKPKQPKPDTRKEKFETAYLESKALPKRERKDFITEKLKDTFSTEEETTAYVERNIERKKVNAAKRRTRLMRKVYLQQWNFFVTFTYDNALHTEDTFKEKLRNTLKHLVSRKQWKYIGVWERSPEKQRLHFHGIFYIPGKCYDWRIKASQRLQHQATPYADHFSEYAFSETFRKKRFQAVRQKGRYYAVRAIFTQIHRKER